MPKHTEVQICEGQFPDGCGSILMEHPEQMTAALIRVLKYVNSYYPGPAPSGGVIEATGMPTAYAYISKLRFFDLAEQAKAPEGYEGPYRGWWLITDKGRWFLEGIHEVPKKVWVFRKEVVRTEGGTVGIEQIKNYRPEVNRETIIDEWEPHDFSADDPDVGPVDG